MQVQYIHPECCGGCVDIGRARSLATYCAVVGQPRLSRELCVSVYFVLRLDHRTLFISLYYTHTVFSIAVAEVRALVYK